MLMSSFHWAFVIKKKKTTYFVTHDTYNSPLIFDFLFLLNGLEMENLMFLLNIALNSI